MSATLLHPISNMGLVNVPRSWTFGLTWNYITGLPIIFRICFELSSKKNSAKPPLDITWNSLGVHCHGHHASGLVMMDLIPSMRSQVEVICPQLCLYLGLSWCTHGSSPECPVQLWTVLLSHLLKQISFPFYHTFTAPWPQLFTICCESPFSLRPCQRSYGTKWWTL